MKKYLRLTFLFFAFIYPTVIFADYSLEQLRIANTLINEAGGLGRESMTYVAEVIRNQYNEQHKYAGNDNITYSDILYHSWKPGGDSNFQHSRDKFADKDKATLERMGRERMKGSTDWQTALDLAGKLINGTLTSNYVGGANAFHGCKYSTLAECQKTEPKYKLTKLSVTPKGFKNQIFYHWDLGRFKHAYDSDTVAQPSPSYSASASQGAQQGETSDGSRDASTCAMEEMQKMYLTEGKVDEYCWYCKIVIVLVNAYLKVANDAIGSATLPLGKVILKWGFLIWLAYYVLQQVSSMNAVTPGKMLQEILGMGFKVALAYAILGVGSAFIRDYYLNPIIGTGVDYGLAIFAQMDVPK